METSEHTDEVVRSVSEYGRILINPRENLKNRFRALFALKTLNTAEAVNYISSCFNDPSALLKHELAYCLGQMGNPAAISALTRILDNFDQEPMVRHEAGEALGAIGDFAAVPTLEKFSSDTSPEVAETCQLALERIRFLNDPDHSPELTARSPYDCRDPAPAFCCDSSRNVESLKQTLLDSKQSLWDRYRAMFSLRNIGSADAVTALATGLSCQDSALFRHEIAFVLGQIRSPNSIQQLKSRLIDTSENCMVRHECAEALGSIATEECEKILRAYASDPDRVVRESCQVALDICDTENSSEFRVDCLI